MTLRGEQKAEQEFEQFVRHHARPLLAYCLRRSPHADAHDAAAEVLSIAWRRFAEVPDGPEALYWLFGVARRVLSNQRRGEARRGRLAQRIGSLVEPPAPGAETVILRNERDQEVIESLANLNEGDREVLVLIVWDEVPRAQVASILNISEQAVHKRYQRALHRLGQRLTDQPARTTHSKSEGRRAP